MSNRTNLALYKNNIQNHSLTHIVSDFECYLFKGRHFPKQ